MTQEPISCRPLDSARVTHSDSRTSLASGPPHSQEENVTRMKVDIHNHILPKEWPDLKQVGAKRDSSSVKIWVFVTSEWSYPPTQITCLCQSGGVSHFTEHTSKAHSSNVKWVNSRVVRMVKLSSIPGVCPQSWLLCYCPAVIYVLKNT